MTRRSPSEFVELLDRIRGVCDQLEDEYEAVYVEGHSNTKGPGGGRATGPGDPTGGVVVAKGRFRGACTLASRRAQEALERLTSWRREIEEEGERVVKEIPGALAVLLDVQGIERAQPNVATMKRVSAPDVVDGWVTPAELDESRDLQERRRAAGAPAWGEA